MRSNMKHSTQCFIDRWNAWKFVKNTSLCVAFSTLFSVFRLVRKHCVFCLIIYYFKARRLPLKTPWLVLKFGIYFALKSFLGVFLGFPNSWLLIAKGVKRCLTSTCLMDKSDFSLHVFIKHKIYSSLEARVYSQT